MRRLHRTFLVGHAWVVAAMTLVAGLPHVVCRCPDGQVKPLRLSLAVGSHDCCELAGGPHAEADSVRPAAPPVAQEPPCCCCHQAAHPEQREPGTSPEVQPPRCAREPVTAPVFVLADDRPAAGKELTAAFSLPPALLSCEGTIPPSGGPGVSPSPHGPAAPADLVLMLRRLVI